MISLVTSKPASSLLSRVIGSGKKSSNSSAVLPPGQGRSLTFRAFFSHSGVLASPPPPPAKQKAFASKSIPKKYQPQQQQQRPNPVPQYSKAPSPLTPITSSSGSTTSTPSTLSTWTPTQLKRDNIGKFFTISHALFDTTSSSDSNIASSRLPSRIAEQFALQKSWAVMHRKIAADLIDLVGAASPNLSSSPSTSDGMKSAAAKPLAPTIAPKVATTAAPKVIMLDGVRGAGKSITLLQTVAHFRALDWIVLYVPSADSWINGSQPYGMSKKPTADASAVYEQPTAVRALLLSWLAMNAPLFQKVTRSPDGSPSTLESLIHQGVQEPDGGHAVLDTILTELSALEPGQFGIPGVMLAVDQANGLYAKTKYFDQKCKEIIAPQLKIVSSFLPFFDGRRVLQSGTIIGSLDFSSSFAHSPYLASQVRKAPLAIGSKLGQAGDTENLLIRDRYDSLETVDTVGGGVLPPAVVAPALHFPVGPASAKPLSEKARRLVIPPLSVEEVGGMLTFFAKAKIAHGPGIQPGGRLELGLVQRKQMITAGNPLKLVKSLI